MGSGRHGGAARTDLTERSATFLGRQALHFSIGVYKRYGFTIAERPPGEDE